MSGEDLVVNAADPVPARADLAVRYGGQVRAERRPKGLEHLLGGIECDTANHQELSTHCLLSLFFAFAIGLSDLHIGGVQSRSPAGYDSWRLGATEPVKWQFTADHASRLAGGGI